MLRKLIRRIEQVQQVLFSDDFESSEGMLRGIIRRYGSSEEIQYYQEIAASGFQSMEREAFEQAIRCLSHPPQNALVVGCGAGREALQLVKLGLSVVATDASSRMIEAAKRIAQQHGSNIHFIEGTWPKEGGFDLIWITTGLINHIPGKSNRIEFLEQARARLNPKGIICFFPDILKMGSSWRFFLGSGVLWVKAKLKNGPWEQGDTVRSYLGNHSQTASLVYYHYYPSIQHVEEEVAAARFTGQILSSGFWVLSSVGGNSFAVFLNKTI